MAQAAQKVEETGRQEYDRLRAEARSLREEKAALEKQALSENDALQDIDAQEASASKVGFDHICSHLKRLLSSKAQSIPLARAPSPTIWRSPCHGTMTGLEPTVEDAIAVLVLAPLVRRAIKECSGQFGPVDRAARKTRIAGIDARLEELREYVKVTPAKLGSHPMVPHSRFELDPQTGTLRDSWPPFEA